MRLRTTMLVKANGHTRHYPELRRISLSATRIMGGENMKPSNWLAGCATSLQ